MITFSNSHLGSGMPNQPADLFHTIARLELSHVRTEL
jgi:hypothetical protein